jgi:hypothetical protein
MIKTAVTSLHNGAPSGSGKSGLALGTSRGSTEGSVSAAAEAAERGSAFAAAGGSLGAGGFALTGVAVAESPIAFLSQRGQALVPATSRTITDATTASPPPRTTRPTQRLLSFVCITPAFTQLNSQLRIVKVALSFPCVNSHTRRQHSRLAYGVRAPNQTICAISFQLHERASLHDSTRAYVSPFGATFCARSGTRRHRRISRRQQQRMTPSANARNLAKRKNLVKHFAEDLFCDHRPSNRACQSHFDICPSNRVRPRSLRSCARPRTFAHELRFVCSHALPVERGVAFEDDSSSRADNAKAGHQNSNSSNQIEPKLRSYSYLETVRAAGVCHQELTTPLERSLGRPFDGLAFARTTLVSASGRSSRALARLAGERRAARSAARGR